MLPAQKIQWLKNTFLADSQLFSSPIIAESNNEKWPSLPGNKRSIHTLTRAENFIIQVMMQVSIVRILFWNWIVYRVPEAILHTETLQTKVTTHYIYCLSSDAAKRLYVCTMLVQDYFLFIEQDVATKELFYLRDPAMLMCMMRVAAELQWCWKPVDQLNISLQLKQFYLQGIKVDRNRLRPPTLGSIIWNKTKPFLSCGLVACFTCTERKLIGMEYQLIKKLEENGDVHHWNISQWTPKHEDFFFTFNSLALSGRYY
nr:hypothetical protein [Microctonus hyperodae filamentous virus]